MSSKTIHLKTSLSAGLFGSESNQRWDSQQEIAPVEQVEAHTEITRSAAMLGSRATSWAAMLALTAAGLSSVVASAAPAVTTDAGDELPKPHANPATDPQTGPAHEVHKFDIPAGSVGDVIDALRKQAGIRISFASDDKMRDIPSPGVHGVLAVREALEQALKDTGLAARFDTPESVQVQMRSNSESVVVTADDTPTNIKYTAPLVDLPQTINVVSQETLQMTASTTLADALRTVPGISLGAGEGGNPLGDRPFIRGLDSQSSTYIDGIRDIASQSRETFDIDSIEVQEGPGGAYGGRGTGGGSINMNSKIARRNNFVAGSFTPGTSNYKRFTVDGNAKLTSWAYGRLVGMFHDQDVAGRDGVHQNRWGFAPSLAFGLGHPTRAFLDYYQVVQNNIPDSGIPYNNPTSTTGATYDGPKYTKLFSAGDGEPIALPYRSIYYGIVGRDKDREYAKIGTGRVERDLWHEHALIRNSFRYERTDQDYLWTLPDDSQGNLYYGLLFRRINSKFNAVFTGDDQTDISGNVKTGHIKHSYATGFEFAKERSNVDTYANTSTFYTSANPGVTTGTESCQLGIGAASAYNCTSLFNPNDHDPWGGASAIGISGKLSTNSITLAHNPAHYNAVTKSVYGFDTITLSKHFLVTVGGRFDNFTAQYRTAPTAATATAAAVASVTYPVTNNLGTYIAGVTYKPDAATSVYATVSTAAIPTGNSLGQGTDVSALNSPINTQLQPETIREEEFGVKREIAGGRALARLAVYREDIQNVRIAIDAAGDVANAGTDRTIGLETGLSGNVTRNLFLTGGYSFIDARLTASAYAAGIGLGSTNGQFMPNTPWSSFSMTGHYTVMKNLNVGGGYYAQSMVWGSQANNKWVKGWQRVDLFGDYQVNRHLDFQVNALNVGDKIYYQQAYATHYAILAAGRTILAGFNVKF